MPYGPEEIHVPPYCFYEAFGRHEREEAAAWFVLACQEAGCWCGVSVRRLTKMISDAYVQHRDQFQAVQAARIQNFHAAQCHKVAMTWWIFLAVMTLGISCLFWRRPEKPALCEVPEYHAAWSFGIHFGPGAVLGGFTELRDLGFVHVECGDSFDVVFPTPELLEPLARFRRTSAAPAATH